MVENLRVRLNEKSKIQDLARAMETPFEIDAYDIGVVGSIAYSPEMRDFYKACGYQDRPNPTKALSPPSVPEVLILRQIQHLLPESEETAKEVLNKLAEYRLNPCISSKRYQDCKERNSVYSFPYARKPMPSIIGVGLDTIQSMYKKMREFDYAEDSLLHKPDWINELEWLGDNFFNSIRSHTIHHFKTTWMQMQGRFEGALRRS